MRSPLLVQIIGKNDAFAGNQIHGCGRYRVSHDEDCVEEAMAATTNIRVRAWTATATLAASALGDFARTTATYLVDACDYDNRSVCGSIPGSHHTLSTSLA